MGVASDSIFLPFLIQLCCVSAVALAHRRGVPATLNILVSSAFVTVPVWYFAPLNDVGMVFLFDLVVPILFLLALYQRFFRLNKSVVIIGILVFFLPLYYSPIGYFFIGPDYVAFHSLILASVLYRSLLIFIALAILTWQLRSADPLPLTRLLAYQFLVLFMFGALQYLGGVDLVVYERVKDVENIVDLLLSGKQKILYGFGFLGLFRGAVAQMALIALFWWLLLAVHPGAKRRERYLLNLMCVLAIVSVGGALSRIGMLAMGLALLYAAFVNWRLRISGAIFLIAVFTFFLSQSDQGSIIEMVPDLMSDRFDVQQWGGQAGSGSTRVKSAFALYDAMVNNWEPWLTGLGGFNPIAANERYGVFGMHGDYLDVVARYGLIVGLLYAAVVFGILSRQLDGFFSSVPERRVLARSFGVLVLGMAILALTQGTLTFSGAAGYLACAQAWMAIAFASAVRRWRKGNLA